MTVYYTLDADGDRIAERASILKADTMQEALDACRASYRGSDFDVMELEVGWFKDCWIKVLDRSTLDYRLAEWTEEAGDLYVENPGQNPGGKAWWITPTAEILVPVLRACEE